MQARHSSTRTLYTPHGRTMLEWHVIDVIKRPDGSVHMHNVPEGEFYEILASLVGPGKARVSVGGTAGTSIGQLYVHPRVRTHDDMQAYKRSYAATVATARYTIGVTIRSAYLRCGSSSEDSSEEDEDEDEDEGGDKGEDDGLSKIDVASWNLVIAPLRSDSE